MWTDLKGASLFAIALACRAPFLWAGYGKEFDAWSNALNARIIAETGIYEVSRLPGHPLQELLLSALWSQSNSYFVFNALIDSRRNSQLTIIIAAPTLHFSLFVYRTAMLKAKIKHFDF